MKNEIEKLSDLYLDRSAPACGGVPRDNSVQLAYVLQLARPAPIVAPGWPGYRAGASAGAYVDLVSSWRLMRTPRILAPGWLWPDRLATSRQACL